MIVLIYNNAHTKNGTTLHSISPMKNVCCKSLTHIMVIFDILYSSSRGKILLLTELIIKSLKKGMQSITELL